MKIEKIPFKLMTQEDGDKVTVYLYGIIGQRPSLYTENEDEDITDMEFLKAVKKYEKEEKKRMDIRINSPGGSTLHLDGIVAQIQTCKMEVHTWVDGIAASAAADIWLSVPKENRHMAKNAKVMIHAPIDFCMGNYKDMEACAEKLMKFTESYVRQMAFDTGKTEEEIMSKYYDGKDHWLTAKDCEQEGLIEKMEDYEAGKMPSDPEKMTRDDLLRHFIEQPAADPLKQKDHAIGIFKQLYNLAFPQKADNISQKIDEEMNIENILKSVDSGEVDRAELLKALQPAPPAPEKKEQDLQQLITAAIEPLQKKIEEQAQKIQELGAQPGDKQTRVPAGQQDAGGGDGDEDDVLKSLNDTLTRAASSGEAVKVNGYGSGLRPR